jgi:hypothetical protein
VTALVDALLRHHHAGLRRETDQKYEAYRKKEKEKEAAAEGDGKRGKRTSIAPPKTASKKTEQKKGGPSGAQKKGSTQLLIQRTGGRSSLQVSNPSQVVQGQAISGQNGHRKQRPPCSDGSDSMALRFVGWSTKSGIMKILIWEGSTHTKKWFVLDRESLTYYASEKDAAKLIAKADKSSKAPKKVPLNVMIFNAETKLAKYQAKDESKDINIFQVRHAPWICL